MTTIATGYYINRAFGITLTLIFLTFSSIQIYLLRQNSKKFSDVKYLIHYSVFGSCSTLLLSFIDSYGVFGLFPYIFSLMTVDVIGMKILSSSVLFIIYGHFTAHYRVLKKEMPQFFKIYLAGVFLFTSICSLILQPLFYVTSNPIFSKLSSINGLIWIFGIWTIDIYGYYLVRKFILELRVYSMTAPMTQISQEEEASRTTRSASPSLHSQTKGSTLSNHFDYDEFLSRMRNFHGLLTFAVYTFAALNLVGLIRGSLRQTLNPSKFSIFDGLVFYPYLYFLLGCFLLWWVWLPIKFSKNCTLDLGSWSGSQRKENSQKSTEVHSSGYKASKRENHHQPCEEEEMVILNQNHNLQENSKALSPPNPLDITGTNQVESSLLQENTQEISVSMNGLDNPGKENQVTSSITMAGITEEGGIVAYAEK